MFISRRACRIGSWIPLILIVFTGVLSSRSAADDAAMPKPLASEKVDKDVLIEVIDVYRGSDGLLQVNWQYRNPTDQRVHFMGGDATRDLPGEIYIVDAKEKKKYQVATVKPQKGNKSNRSDFLSAQPGTIDLQPGACEILWAKFLAPPDSTKEISLYVPGAPPLEDLPIQAHTPAQPAAASENAPLAKEKHQTGAQVEVTRVRRSSDGTVDVRWRYVNPGKEKLNLWGSDEARDLVKHVYVMDPDSKTKYLVATDDRKQPLAAKLSGTQIEPGKSEDVWMKFAVPVDAKRISLFLPGAIPIEDLSITERK